MALLEFIGVPGSGKSTIAKRVKQQRECDGLPTLFREPIDAWIEGPDLPPRIRMSCKDTLAAAQVELCACRLAATVRPRRLEHFRNARRLAGWYRRTQYLSYVEDLVIQDEGVLNLVLATVLHGEQYATQPLTQLVRCIASEPHRQFVYVRCSAEVTMQRRRRRAGHGESEREKLWRYEQADADQEEQIQHECQMLHDVMADAIRNVASVRMIVVNNE
ncbi:MAG: hypothetical protein WD079_05330, partial [Phycisphaeraceae bacterium]